MLPSCQRRVHLYGPISVHNGLAELRQDGTAATAASSHCLPRHSALTPSGSTSTGLQLPDLIKAKGTWYGVAALALRGEGCCDRGIGWRD